MIIKKTITRTKKLILKTITPQSVLLKKKYYQRMGTTLNLKNPKTFNEKIQWLKLHDKNPEYSLYVDKYEAKRIVAKWIGEEYIIPTLGIWDNYKQIDFNKLPEKFVLKCTHDSESVKICKTKTSINHAEWEKWFEDHLTTNFNEYWGEWVYKKVKHRIIAEKYLDSLDDEGVIDYKFFCFGGKPEFLYVSVGLEDHSTAKISFYDMRGNEMPFYRKDFNRFHDVVLPKNFNEMKRIAETIAKKVGNPFVRVDLYSIKNNIYFSEITFYPNAGYIPFEPPEWDLKLGSKISLPCDK